MTTQQVPTRDDGVMWGYTLRDLDRMTHAAMIADRSLAMDYADRRDIAWSAIAEALCAAPHWPARHDLIRAGWQGIYRAVREEYRQHGYAERAWQSGHATAPRFVQYWYKPIQPSHEERIVERLAVDQVLATLTPACRAALMQLATWEDTHAAADALGVTYAALMRRLRVARRHIDALWHEGETPHWPAQRNRGFAKLASRRTDACGNGHPWTPETTREARSMVNGRLRSVVRRCLVCERERSARRAKERTQKKTAATDAPSEGLILEGSRDR